MNVKHGSRNERDLFYEVMDYPYPATREEGIFSWNEKNPYLDSYLDFIHQWGKLYKNLPFVEKIYLCNSLTFNSLNAYSDIDLFFVVKEKRIWTARFFCLVLFSLFRIKRSLTDKTKKFCLSFFVTSEHQILDAIALDFWDPYLEHWVQHLSLLYQDPRQISQNSFLIFSKSCSNYSISLWNKVFRERGSLKKIFEFLFSWILGKIFEMVVKFFQLILINWKKKKAPDLNRDVVVSDVMLKFYFDKREEYKKMLKEKMGRNSRWDWKKESFV